MNTTIDISEFDHKIVAIAQKRFNASSPQELFERLIGFWRDAELPRSDLDEIMTAEQSIESMKAAKKAGMKIELTDLHKKLGITEAMIWGFE